MEMNALKGTTTVGVTFKNGVVIAADKRASAGTFIASKRAKKIHNITDKIVFTISGLVADAQVLVKWVRSQVMSLIYSTEREPLVSEVTSLTATVLHSNFRSLLPFLVHFIVGGVDRLGPHIFFLDHAGGKNEEKYIATGSGSPVALGVLEDGYKDGLDEDEAVNLALRALRSAISRDAATGDGVDLAIVTNKGTRYLTPKEINKRLSTLAKTIAEG